MILKSSVYKDASVREYFRGEFDRYGSVSGRVEFRSASTHADMLAEYADVDIALDPFPFSGALTSCEALWMGIPIVTLCQIRPVSRQTMGILKQLGLDKYSTDTPGSYLQVASELARNVDNLMELRHSLRERMLGSPLTDGLKMAIALEKVFHRIAREKPRSLTEGQSFSRETMSSKYAEESEHKQY